MSVRPILVVAATLALAVPATGSLVEESTSGTIAYQFDGDSHHDAPDGCSVADPAWSLSLGSSTDGILLPPDDATDVFVVDVPRRSVGSRLNLEVADPTGAQGLQLDAFSPDCISILDAVNWPSPQPSPPAPAAGEQQVAADVSAPHHCQSDHTVFVADALHGAPAPATIHVAWTDGSEHAVDLYWSGPQHAVYATQDRIDVLLKGAWINLPSAWAGDFVFFAGNCDAVDGGAVYGSEPTVGDGLLSFTPIRPGPYAVQVRFLGGAAPSIAAPVVVDPSPLLLVDPHEASHDPQGAVEDLVALAMAPPPPQDLIPSASVPASCHFCLGAVEDLVEAVSYRLSGSVS